MGQQLPLGQRALRPQNAPVPLGAPLPVVGSDFVTSTPPIEEVAYGVDGSLRAPSLDNPESSEKGTTSGKKQVLVLSRKRGGRSQPMQTVITPPRPTPPFFYLSVALFVPTPMHPTGWYV